MTRPARLNHPGRFYHVISRFVDRTWFLSGHEERETYLRMHGHAMRQTDWRCIAYALMSNHLHFAMVAGELDMQSWTKSVNGTFAQWMNRHHKRLGPVFAERPTDFEVLPADQGDVIAYIHNNPVRAGVVDHARDSAWTSHRAYVGLSQAPEWLGVGEGLARCGLDRASFDGWVDANSTAEDRPEVKVTLVAARRRGALNVATPARRRIPLVARPFARIRPDPTVLVQIVARLAGVSETAMCSRRRPRSLVEARRLLVHVAKTCGLCGSDIAAVLGISPQAVSKLAARELDTNAKVQATIALQIIDERYGKVALVDTVPKATG